MSNHTPLSDEAAALNERLAKEWPDRWAKADTSKKRNRLRAALRVHDKIVSLQQEGASCSNCSSFQGGNPSPGITGPWCMAGSDYAGYLIVAPDDVCERWRAAFPSAAVGGRKPVPSERN